MSDSESEWESLPGSEEEFESDFDPSESEP
jgi:hypothetical protein